MSAHYCPECGHEHLPAGDAAPADPLTPEELEMLAAIPPYRATTPPDALREALEIIAASPFPAMSTDAIGITARNIARLALRPTSEPGRLWREAADALAATPAPLALCGASFDEFTCNRGAGHDGDHKDMNGTGGLVGWRNATPAPLDEWQQGYDAGYKEGQEDANLIAPTPLAPGPRAIVDGCICQKCADRGDECDYGAEPNHDECSLCERGRHVRERDREDEMEQES